MTGVDGALSVGELSLTSRTFTITKTLELNPPVRREEKNGLVIVK